jgi:hypothetical protein
VTGAAKKCGMMMHEWEWEDGVQTVKRLRSGIISDGKTGKDMMMMI